MAKPKQQYDRVFHLVPVFCPECRSKDTFKPYPKNDVKDGQGEVLEHCYKCSVCEHETLSPASQDNYFLGDSFISGPEIE